MTELVEYKENAVAFVDSTPEGQLEVAGKVAKLLVDVIEKQKLYTNIGGKKYVNVEGWQAMGSFLKVLPKEREVIRYDNGTYEAHVDLVDRQGQVIGSGSAICGADESMWMKRPEYARRSMAITRATGKAYRIAFSWVMNMAGYEPTPREEMDHVEPVIYEGTNNQKIKVMNILKNDHAIDDPNVMKEVHQYLLDNNINFSALENAIGNYIAERTL